MEKDHWEDQGVGIVSPHVLPHRLTVNHYRDFLIHDLPKYLEGRARMRYIHDGAPAYFSRTVRVVLNNACHDDGQVSPKEDKIDDIKDRIYEELEHAFDKFPKYPMKLLLGDFNAKAGREDIFKPTIGNESLHEISNDNGVRVVNFATSKNRNVKSTMFPHRNIHKFTWTSPDGKTHNQIDHILIERRRHSSILDVQSFRAADCDTDHYLVVAKVRERLAVSKQTTHRLHMERFNLKKLNEVEGKEQYCVEISNRFAALENLDTEVDVNKTSENIRENIKESLAYYEPKKHKP
ncbi:hypothetical protein B7P43_G05764 [Cryptotermes secundus]|uniref:Endonuclease/exonuclease/phosphatase domain-containing protein n=1 Tax=Cryptotermes secundus TaxID=105785 RepID=A0A2J7Q0P3_9NEOP|nr:hypothetical protein B7P43_G05764 [Cryptotermes secundus]